MPSAKEYLAEPPLFLLLVLGPPNSGKSDLAMTFPSSYVGSFDPGGFQIIKNKSERAQALATNLRYIENFNPRGDREMKRLFARTKKLTDAKPGSPATFGPMTADDRSISLMGWLAHIEQVAQAKEVQTVVLDGFNYLVDQYEFLCRNDTKNQVEVKYGERAGQTVLDSRAAYMDLKNYLSQFMWSELLPLCVRYGLNLIVSSHVMRLSEEQIEGKDAVVKDGKTVVAASKGTVQQNSEIAAQITGKFKEAIEGKFANVLIMEHVLSGKVTPTTPTKKHCFRVYCDKAETESLGEVNAKNKHSLPSVLDITNKSFYEELLARTAGLPIQTGAKAK